MKVNGYELSEWTFSTGGEIAVAKKGGKKYFLKRYNSALKPTEGMSAGIRAVKEEAFARLSGRRARINRALDEIDDPAVVKTVETFVHDCHLVEVSSFVENAVDASKIAILPEEQKAEALLSAVNAVCLIHKKGLVHSDIKPSNLLMVRAGGKVEARLIDFDSSYFVDEKLSLKGVGGDDFYGAPETVANMSDNDPEIRGYLSEKADIFSLGLTLYEYETGNKYETHCEETRVWSLVCDGVTIDVGDDVKEPMRTTINKMLSYDPEERPTAEQIRDAIALAITSAKRTAAANGEDTAAGKKEDAEVVAGRGTSSARSAARGGASVMHSPEDGYPLIEPWREDNIEFVGEGLDLYGFCKVERILDHRNERYYRLIKRNGVNLLRKKEQLIIMGCAREKSDKQAAEKKSETSGLVADCEICEPWSGHAIKFAKETLIGIGCKKVERAGASRKMYRFVFERISETIELSRCLLYGYAVRLTPVTITDSVSDRRENRMWEGDVGVFSATAMERRKVVSIARCIHNGRKEYEVTFRASSGKSFKRVLDHSSLRILGLIVC